MKIKSIIVAISLCFGGGVSAKDAEKLGAELTPVGAIKAGNADGSIPEWTGGLEPEDAPADFQAGSGRWADPFADEKPLFSITASNIDQYGEKVSESAKELLKRFPESFRLDVYPTHRTVGFDEDFYRRTKANLQNCQLIENGNAIEGCFGGVPFPLPESGLEVIWNITTAPKPARYEMTLEGVYVDSSGDPIQSAEQRSTIEMPYHDESGSVEEFERNGQRYFLASAKQLAPARIAGDGNLITYTSNPIEFGNKAWMYQQGNRRVRVIPQAEYDFPTTISGGAAYYDEITLFMGNPDRFDFKLLGKREMYIPYNTQRSLYITKEELAGAGDGMHPNPDHIRWELHRVWVVEATLKEGARHASSRRVYYIDEDYYAAGMMDSWDRAGEPHKLVMQLPFMAYDVGAPVGTATLTYDLSTGVFYQNVLINQPKHGIFIEDQPYPASFFTPEGLRRRSSR